MRPVTAIVTTVVVMSGTLSDRTAAFWIPMAMARSAATAIATSDACGSASGIATGMATAMKTSWSPTMRTISLPRPREPDDIRPPTKAPIMNAARATSEVSFTMPGTPANASPRTRMLPVMFATNTRPRVSRLTASMMPATVDSTSNSAGSGPCTGWRTRAAHQRIRRPLRRPHGACLGWVPRRWVVTARSVRLITARIT